VVSLDDYSTGSEVVFFYATTLIFASLSLRIAATITASLHPPTRKQPKVDKTPFNPIIDLVIMIIREMISQHVIASDFQNSLLFFPVLREKGIVIGSPIFERLAARALVCRNTICTIR
jgi:hypothetical protein